PHARPVTGSAVARERRIAGVPPALIGPLALLALITAAIAGRGEIPLALLCHLYLVPALWAAWVAGMTAAGVVGLLAGLLQAPFVLKGIERSGLEAQSPEGIAGMVLPAALGLCDARLSDQSRARAARLTAVLAVQRNLLADTPFEARLSLVADGVRAALGADWVGPAIAGAGTAPERG